MTNFCITGMMTTTGEFGGFTFPLSVFQTKQEPTYVKPAPIQPPVDAVWLVSIEYRKYHEPETLGPFKTKESAIRAIREHFNDNDWLDIYTEFGSDINEGNVFTEEETVETYWRVIE